MATATATITTNKAARASELRAQGVAHSVKNLRNSAKNSRSHEAWNRSAPRQTEKFTEEDLRRRIPKPGEIAALDVAIDEAQIPCRWIDGAGKRKARKRTLDTVRANLELSNMNCE